MIRHVTVRGRVQGVGYRAFVEDEALRLGLEGWVRNRRDGTVEAVFSGADHAVEKMIEACHRGPLGARVQQLLATLCEKVGLGNKAERYRQAAITEIRSLGDRNRLPCLCARGAEARLDQGPFQLDEGRNRSAHLRRKVLA